MWKKIVEKIRKSEEVPEKKKIKYTPDSVFPSREIQDKVEKYLMEKRA